MSAGEGEVEEEAGGAALLAEAAGYLSTLGANLRARADALREKRLGRRAPTNALGLRRVVDKLLLICELSRRSLDNVEAGVGRVLRACQRRADPPRARHRTELRRVGRHILKVPAHISLEHYRSCRVRAAQLPQGDCDFYPVYFDCAALRARRTQPNSKKNAEKCEEIENIERRTTARPNPPVDGRDSTDMFVSVDTDQNKKIYNSEDSMSDSRPQNTNDSNDAKKATKRSNRKDSNISQKSKLYEDDNDNSNENQKNKTEKSESKKIYTSEDSMSASRPQNTKEKSEKFKHICEHSISDPKSKRDADNSEINNGDSGVKEMNSKLINNNDNTEKSKHEGEHSESSLINKATVKDLNIAQLRKDNKDSDGTEAALKSHTNSEKSKYATSHLKDKENDNNSNVTFSERDNNELDEIALADKAKIENIDNTCQSKNNIEVVETKEKSKKHNRDNKKSRHRRKSVFISDKEQSSDENTGPNNDTGSSENYPQKNSKILNSQHISADCSDERIIEKKYDGHESKQKERKSDKSHGPKSKRRLNQILSSDEEGQIKNRSEKESENREDPEVNESIDTIIEATEETIKGQSTKNSSTFDPAKFNDQTKGDSDSSKSEKVDTEKSNKAKSSNLNKENNSNESPKSIMSESDEDNLTSIKSPSKDSHGETDVKSDDFEKERQMNKIPDNNINPNSGQKGEESPTFTPTFTPTKVHDDNSQSQDGSESSNKPMIKCVDLSKLLRTPENAMNMLKSPQKCDDLLVESHSAARACEESKYAQKIRMKEKRAKERDKATHNKEKVTKKEVTTIIDLDTTDDDESVPISKRILTRKKRVKYKNLTSSDLSDEDLKQKNKGKPGSRTRKNDNSSSRKITVKQAKDLVATFKPKKFDIQVGKMPTFSNKFLEKHSLSLISQNGSIIAKLTQDSVVINAKTDLLSDSSDSVKSKDHRKRKNSSDAKSPKAKRRHLMESARAKRLLLTYSSSDTEDDLVKEALNEIAEAVKDLGPNEKENKKAQDTLKQKPIEIEKKKAQDSEKQKLLCSSSSSLSDEDKINNALKELEDEIKVGKQNIGNGSGSEDNKFESEEQMSGIKEKNSRRERSKSSSIEKTRERRENKSKSEKEISASEGSKENKSGRGDQRSVSEEKTLESEEIMSGDEKVRSGSEEDRLGSKDKRSGSIERSKSVQNSDKSEEEAPRKKLKRTASEEIKPDDKRSDSKTSSISQVDGNYDETSSGSEMGRTTRSQASNSSDSREDKAIESLTNLKSLHSKHRQRDSPSSSDDSNASKKHKSNAAKAKSIRDDNLLELDSKSSSEVDSDGPVEIPDMAEQNGDPVIGEVARDDLLNDTDSDSTQRTGKDETEDTNSKSNGKTKGDKKSKGKGKSDKKKVLELDSSENEESDNDDLKVRRRKAVTISSDSEAGSSKKKKNKDSDYEHSKSEDSDDSAAHFKKTKRKGKKSSDSEGSMSRSSDGGKSKKKRRRIKQVDSEGSDGSGSENEGKKSGRKNIRKVMGKDQLEEATKKAAREERERVARITERQKLYNNTAFDESGKPDEVILEKVVLDFDPDTKKPLIQVDKGIVKKLKPHQANGIKFMWDACFESVKQIKKGRGSGCILAHCMGLGKTLQVVSLTHTLLAHEELTGVRRVLVVCPLSTVLNWVNEFRMWLEFAEDDHDIQIYELSRYKQNTERAYQLREWLESGGVCVLGYEMFRNLSADNPKKFRKKLMAAFQESLVDPGPDLVVCDEGHLLKNEKTSLSQSMNRIRTLRRIVLTGTPLQNNLKEYYCMVQFVKPNLLGKYNEYLNRFVNPITNGQYTDSTEHDIRIMKRRSHVLHKMLDGAVQRRDYGVLAPFLPPKHEYVLFITLTEIQVKLYQHYMDNYSRRQQAGKTTGFLFQDFQSLQRIWTHPLVLKANSERYEIAQQKKRDREEEEEDTEGSLVDFLDDDSTAAESTTEDDSDVLSDVSDDSRKKSKKKSPKKSKVKAEATSSSAASARRTRANPGDKVDEIDFKDLKDPVDVRMENPTEWWIKMVEEKELEDMRNSNKLMLLFDILRQCEAIGDKLLVFSQSLYSLDLIEHFLSKIDEATQMGKVEESLAGHVGSWSPGIDYFRLDGSTSCENRSIWCKNFNKEDNPRARLFLISTRAGGLGINLVAANRVVIFDVSWNPSHDVQSIFRVYRFGQKKPCYVYRFLAMGTMEEKIYERQVTKQAISKRVIDEQQIDRHYAENDLAELYTFQPEPEQPRPVPLLPKDRLFAEMLKEHEKLIYRYHEHDSLLENKEEETLTEEERKAAWEDFENEKNRPPPVPFNNTPFLPQMNGMGNMMAQQQQLMMATMLNVIRKDYPGLSEQQIANILPQILYGEPMMQKMRAMTGMGSNLMMNPAAAAAGGTSALAFQPTWQQQQQMQLQRIQQQQQALNSGVKYYSGGLGSRDPLSMALQQKQQREMMLNNTGDRLRDMLVGSASREPGVRGRPPQLPPPAHSGEVVNLDDSE